MKINSLGHVILRVTSLERAEAFYSGLLVARRHRQGQVVQVSIGRRAMRRPVEGCSPRCLDI
jgi:catechol 2,3-dioxygenase-like lactoylglutathione lyase family enzyme